MILDLRSTRQTRVQTASQAPFPLLLIQMLAVAGSKLARRLLLPSLAPLSASTPSTHSISSRAGPLSLFICAVEEGSDQAGAALVAALKQLLGRDVELHGVGGPHLADLGLQNVVPDEQLQVLAAAEVVPPTYKLLQDPQRISKHSYAKIFRDTIWEAALEGCRGKAPPAQQQQQQQQQQEQQGAASVPTTTSSSSSSSVPAAGRHLCYDAVVTVGSPMAAQLTLNFLRQAEQMRKAKLPVVVQYTVPGLWDRDSTSAAAARWSKLVDHVLCSMPFEPALLHAAGVPSTFVGHPLVHKLLGSSTSTQSFGGKARVLTHLLKQQQQQQQQRQRQRQEQSLFISGNAAAFWRCYDEAHALQQQAAAAEAAAAAAAQASSSSNSSSSSGSSSSSASSQTAPPATSRRQAAAAGPLTHPQQQQQQQGRLLLALLPGTTEAEVVSSMAAFDYITQQLQQQHPHLIATLHVPDILVQPAVLATLNFKVPVLVVAEGEKRAADALAAAAAAVSHPGPASLAAAAAGVPLVCVRDGSLLRGVWSKWRRRQQLPYGCVPNLLLGGNAVPEAEMWDKGSVEAAVGVLSGLLQAHSSSPSAAAAAVAGSGEAAGLLQARSTTPTAAAAGGSGEAAGQQLVQQHRQVLQEVLLQLVPRLPGGQQQQQQQAGRPGSNAAVSSGSSGSSSSGAGLWQLPAEAAARTLLELIQLQEQQDEARRLAAGDASGSSSSSSSSSGSSGGGNSSSREAGQGSSGARGAAGAAAAAAC